MSRWWQFLGEAAKKAWDAQQWVESASDRVRDEARERTREAAGNVAGAVGEGARTAWQTAAAGLNWYDRNVADPVGGIMQLSDVEIGRRGPSWRTPLRFKDGGL